MMLYPQLEQSIDMRGQFSSAIITYAAATDNCCCQQNLSGGQRQSNQVKEVDR